MIFKIRKFINPPYSIKEMFSILGAVIIITAVPIILTSGEQQGQTSAQSPKLTFTDTQIAQRSTLKVLELKKDINEATSVNKKPIINDLVKRVRARKKLLSNMIEKDPEAVLRVALPKKLISDLPTEAKKNLEEEVTVSGELEILNIDNFKNKKFETKYFLKTKENKLSLYPTGDPDIKESGTPVQITGVKVEEKIAFDPENKKNLKVLPASTDTIGDQKVAVILVNFQNNTSQPLSKTTASNVVFNSVNSFYQEASYSKTSISGTVFGWYTLPINQTCSWGTINDAAIKAADPDIYFPDYSRIIYAFPGSCGWAGLGSVGKWTVSTADGNIRASQAWILTQYFDLRVVGHELGHNLGAEHANAWECGTQSLDGSCNSTEYGDPYDVMGLALGHFNAYHKDFFGWFDPQNTRVITVDSSVTIDAIENTSTNLQVVKIPRDKDQNGNPLNYLYLEFRQKTGYDSSLYGNVFDGALVHWSPGSRLIDTTPNSVVGSSDKYDGAISIGNTFIDANGGIKISSISKTSSSLSLDLDVGNPACNRANPIVSVQPTQSFAQPGSTVTLTISVTNNDSNDCAASTFSLSPAVPVGWSSDLNLSELSINPQESASASLNITSNATTSNGFYFITVVAANSADATYKGSANATHIVFTDLEDPTVAITSPLAGDTVSGSVSVTANATDDRGVAKVEFFVDGLLKSTDTTVPYSFNWNTTGLADGTYTLGAKAYDLLNKTGSSSPVSVIVSNQDNQAPSIPSGLSATVISETQLNLSWSASIDNVAVVGYKIYRDGGEIASVATTSYADRTVSLGGTYQYAVSAFDTADNESAKTALKTVTIPDLTDPETPTGLKKVSANETKVSLSWNASRDNVAVTGYGIYRDNIQLAVVGTTSYTDNAVAVGKTYQYSITAKDAVGNESLKSSSTTITIPDLTTPSVPTGLAGTTISSSRIDLSWNASRDNVAVTGYKLYRNGILIKKTSSTKYSDRAVSSKKAYFYQVVSYDAAGNNSAKSDVVKVTTPFIGTPKTISKLGDLNRDGKINIRDLSILLSKWRTSYKTADINDDSRVDIRDLSILLSRWGR